MKTLMSIVMVAATAMAFAQEPAKPVEKNAAKAPRAMRQNMHNPRMMSPSAMGRDANTMALRNPKVQEKLGLSDEQKQKIKQLFAVDRNADRELQNKVNAAMKHQYELMNAPKLDEAAIMAAVDEVFEARKVVTKKQIKRTIELKAILTPEQTAKLPEVMQAIRAERANRKPPEPVKLPAAAAPNGEPPPPPPPADAKPEPAK